MAAPTIMGKAVRALKLAQIYAEDGAVVTAIELANEAIQHLEKLKARREKLMRTVSK